MLKPADRVQLIDVDQLRPSDANPRGITAERFEALKSTIVEQPDLLLARPIIARETGEVVGGNMRQRAAAALKSEGHPRFLERWPAGKVPTFVRELTDEQARLWMLLDNNPFGHYDDQLLGELLYDLEQRGADLSQTGFEPERLTTLLDAVDGRKGANRWPDEPAPDPPDTGRSKSGHVYRLGPHRLMCGDATNPKHVAKLLAGAAPKICVTDPPYGVALDMSWRRLEQRRPDAKRNMAAATDAPGQYVDSIKGDDRVDWSEVLDHVPTVDIVYWWHASSWGDIVGAGLRQHGFAIAQTIIWDKIAFTLSRGHYQWRHESAFYATAARPDTEIPWYGPVHEGAIYARRKGSKVPWLGGHDQPTIWSAPSPRRRMEGSDDEVDHPTQKPVLLYTRPYQNHTLRGDAVYEPFSGSGSAIIAAEMTGRVAYAMELDPRFVDVARDRYKLFVEEGTTP